MHPIMRELHETVAAATRRSRHRDRWSRERVHPVQHDINQLVHFIIARRRRHDDAFDAARTVLAPCTGNPRREQQIAALRMLVSVVRRGRYSTTMLRRCERIEGYCDLFETAMAICMLIRHGEQARPRDESCYASARADENENNPPGEDDDKEEDQ